MGDFAIFWLLFWFYFYPESIGKHIALIYRGFLLAYLEGSDKKKSEYDIQALKDK